MNISDELENFSTFMTHEALSRAVKRPTSLCPEEIEFLIPSIQFGKDGLFLLSLFLITKKYICEIHLARKGDEFDFVARNTIRDYRINLSQQTIKVGDEEITYATATVSFLHVGTDAFTTIISYVGNDRETWLQSVLKALPISLVVES